MDDVQSIVSSRCSCSSRRSHDEVHGRVRQGSPHPISLSRRELSESVSRLMVPPSEGPGANKPRSLRLQTYPVSAEVYNAQDEYINEDEHVRHTDYRQSHLRPIIKAPNHYRPH